jgi:hypothetical protein
MMLKRFMARYWVFTQKILSLSIASNKCLVSKLIQQGISCLMITTLVDNVTVYMQNICIGMMAKTIYKAK